MIASFQLRLDMYDFILEAVTAQDVAEFNAEFGLSYSREQFAYIAPTVSLIDDLLKNLYGRPIAFRAKEFKARWSGDVVKVEVEVTYTPYLFPN